MLKCHLAGRTISVGQFWNVCVVLHLDKIGSFSDIISEAISPITPETWLRINKDYATLQFFWIDDKNISFLKERNLDCTNTRKCTIILFKSKHIYLEFKSLFNCNTTLIIDKFLLFLFTQLSPYKTNLLKHFHRFKSN